MSSELDAEASEQIMDGHTIPASHQGGEIRHRWRFAVVLAASLLLAVAQPLTSGRLDEQGSFDVFFSLLIVAVLLLVFEEREHRRIAFSLGLAAFLAVWLGHGIGGPAGGVLLVGALLLAACFFAFALYGILRAVLVKQASGDAIFGAVCGYLSWASSGVSCTLASRRSSPGLFACRRREAPRSWLRLDRGTLGYFSFITLATVGYGDVTPATPLARTLAWMEAVTGQFYLAVLVAGLVGFKVTRAMNN